MQTAHLGLELRCLAVERQIPAPALLEFRWLAQKAVAMSLS